MPIQDRFRPTGKTAPALRACVLGTVGAAALHAVAAHAQTAPAAPAAAAPAAPATVTLPAPGMSAPLSLNPNPYALDVGPLGKWYVGGALTGLGIVQSHPAASDNGGQFDISNGQIFLQKIDGLVQFYVQVGAYTLPTVGTAYVPARHALNDYFGVVPIAYIKLAPSSAFNIEAGKLPTLIGAETNFTFANMNIERGLLWNQEPAISRGVQASYTVNTVTASLSLNDGYYSNVYNWVSGSIVWTMNSASTLTVAGGGNVSRTNISTFATPIAQNNSSIYNLIYTYSHGPWTITPYFQASTINAEPTIGLLRKATSYGGAVLATYAFNSNWSLGGRVEYLTSDGTPTDGEPNLLYGPGSNAVSVTVTPTWQYNRFFVRGEVSYVSASSTTSGDAFGKDGTQTDQLRGLMEAGVLF
jgi:hypothetical protein